MPRESTILDASGRPFQLTNSLENPALSLDDPETWEGVRGYRTTSAGVRMSAATAIGQPAIWRAICLISGDVARLPLSLYEREENGGKTRARRHPAFRLLRRKANPWMTASSLKRTMTYHALMHGNGCAAIWRDGMGRPTELLLLDPEATCLLAVEGQLWFVTEIQGEQLLLHVDDVLHIKGLSHDGLWGHNVIEIMAEAFGLGAAARQFGARFFGEGTQASGLLMVPGHFDETKAKNTLAAWKEMQQGLKNSHRVALLQDGVKWQQLTIPPETAQFLETRQFEIREVANVFGIPAHKLGDDTKTSHNSLEAENASYIDDCLDQWLVEWEEQADLKLLTEAEQENETHFHEFNRNARLRTDAKTRSEVYRTLAEVGGLSANDILRRENMPTIGKIGDQRFRPSNWVPLDAPAPPAPGANAQARAKLLDCLIDRLDRLQRIEAKKQSADFYAQFGTQITEAITPIVAAAWAVLAPGRDSGESIRNFLASYLGARRTQLEAGAWAELELRPLAESLLPTAV